jgi:hypothetical protein
LAGEKKSKSISEYEKKEKIIPDLPQKFFRKKSPIKKKKKGFCRR